MEVLPCDRVALMGQQSITIFPIPNVKDSESASWAPSHVLDLEKFPMDYTIFRSFHDREFSIIVFFGYTHITAVRIVHLNLQESRIIPLASQDPGNLPLSMVGLSRAIIGPDSRFSKIHLVDYDWDMASIEQPHIHVTESIVEVPHMYRSDLIAYSEDTGRLVLYKRRNYTVYVYDPLLWYIHLFIYMHRMIVIRILVISSAVLIGPNDDQWTMSQTYAISNPIRNTF